MINKNQDLTTDNFFELLKKKDKLYGLIENISCCKEHSILGICEYLLENPAEYGVVVLEELQPFLKNYGLAYEDEATLNIEGENFVIMAIYNNIYNDDIYDYNMSVFGKPFGVLDD